MTESTTTGNSSKRRRVADGLLHCRRLSDLPIEPLTHVATFLAAPSRAIFAVALTTVHHSFQGDGDGISAQKIAGFEWDTLDFGHIEKELAERLSDDDMNAILRCIDAVHKLKILKLTNCINITGVGLEPLRGSRIIAKIDMSLVGEHKSPLLNPEPPISRDVVLPILDSILDGEGSALKQIQFPKKWRNLNAPPDEDFFQFMRRFNDIMILVKVGMDVNVLPAGPVQTHSAMIVKRIEGIIGRNLMLFAAHAKNVTVQIVQLCINVVGVKMVSVVHALLLQSALGLNVKTSIIFSVSTVEDIAKDARDCIVQIVALNINVMYVMSSVVASVPRITNARIVTSHTVMNAPRRQASIKCTHVEIAAENNALVAVYVFLIQPNVAALGAST
ncbi:hypothetical protein ACHAWC_004423 [Mediolabrus comicus]